MEVAPILKYFILSYLIEEQPGPAPPLPAPASALPQPAGATVDMTGDTSLLEAMKIRGAPLAAKEFEVFKKRFSVGEYDTTIRLGSFDGVAISNYPT